MAIFGIVIFHLLGAGPIPSFWSNGYIQFQTATFGQLIDVLFIVSGFVVFMPTAARGNFGSYGRYAIRRAARLLPAYWLILILTMLVLAYAPTEFERTFPSVAAIAMHAFGLQTLTSYSDSLGAVGFGVVGPVWTLTVEIGFYLVLPFVAMAFYRHVRLGLLAGALIAVAWTQAGLNANDAAAFIGLDITAATAHRISLATGTQFPFWAFSFALGMAGARLFVACRRRWTRAELEPLAVRAQLAGLAGLVICAVLIYLDPDSGTGAIPAEVVRYSPLVSLGFSASLATFMIAVALGPPAMQRPFANRPIRWLAEISYGVYLSHALFIFLAVWTFGYTLDQSISGFLVLFAGVMPASILYGYLSARFLEQPIRRWARKFGGRADQS